MIQKITRSILTGYYRPVKKFVKDPLGIQQRTLDYLLKHGRNTLYGKENNFHSIRNSSDFARIPVISYEELRPWLDRIILHKQQEVLWDTPVKWFAMSSGTTEDKSKYIPVTKESLYNGNYRAGYHMLGVYARHHPDTAFILGKTLVLGGSQQINRIGGDIYTGDISAILMRNLPAVVKRRRTPEGIALLPDWEEKLQKLADYAVKADIRAMVGVPSWMLVLLKKIVEDTGRTIPEIWPHLEVFFHGGVGFLPFQEQYEKLIPSAKMHYWETYNASEGFFGVQFSPASKDMLLLLDNEVYYEFIPAGEWDRDNPVTLPLSEVEAGRQYAVVISTSGGLWRYRIGDTIQFTSTHPYLFKITGRTKQFINAFGEELIVENADKAISEACRLTGSKVTEYTAAPVYFGEQSNGAHEWLIEFETPPANLVEFTHILDESLKRLNSDYEAKRSYNLSLGMPVVKIVEKDTFYNWMKQREKTGGQNKVPKLSNDRKYVDSILYFIGNNTQ
ncbi:GH3 auxin-responsive promoter [Porphyromonadaceae bacterium NLAE-zl-C104]|uniref:GH3 auxin-responsive promoter family protein n=1 Tax=Proteiniphilum saccharofermentans TaxID=1642647 RepID=UPI0008E0F083|nr:GH3 auxin-responsive promoter family protein [Proteiniphilum saccharofermentans]SFS97307.1 GH3 auxin-responsive promoter [Porphyromonadaceae bacterium NLAE-zl-C104]